MFESFKEGNVARKLSSVDDLELNDIIRFQFLPQQDISGKQFQVIAIMTYDFEHENYPRFALQGEQEEIVFISVLKHLGEQTLVISKKVVRNDIDGIFGLDPFADVFEPGSLTLTAKDYPPLAEWLGKSYYKAIDCRQGYRHIGDYRHEPLPEYEDESSGTDYYLLRDEAEKFAIEIDVCDDDESDVYVVCYHPVTAIAEYWPHA